MHLDFVFCFAMENRDKDQRYRGKSKLQVVLARKRVLCLGYTLLHERAFLHYFHLNQITSLQHLIRVSFLRQLNQLKMQSTLHNIGDTYLKRFLVNVFQTSAATNSIARIEIARY